MHFFSDLYVELRASGVLAVSSKILWKRQTKTWERIHEKAMLKYFKIGIKSTVLSVANF